MYVKLPIQSIIHFYINSRLNYAKRLSCGKYRPVYYDYLFTILSVKMTDSKMVVFCFDV